MSFESWMAEQQAAIHEALQTYLPPIEDSPTRLHEAMRYSVLQGGKRLRPLLMLATAEYFELPVSKALPAACAVEIIHAYSLIHDDLPAMDDDDLRRGLPTCHKAFDEATAILAGDALQALAFELLADPISNPALSSEQRLQMLLTLSQACGSYGMAGGQALDLAATGQHASASVAEVTCIHSLKTGALFAAAVDLICVAAEANRETRASLNHYASVLGLAFQIHDDILDIEAPTEVLGKKQGADHVAQKATYPASAGLEIAKEKVNELHTLALSLLKPLGDRSGQLLALTNYLLQRKF